MPSEVRSIHYHSRRALSPHSSHRIGMLSSVTRAPRALRTVRLQANRLSAQCTEAHILVPFTVAHQPGGKRVSSVSLGISTPAQILIRNSCIHDAMYIWYKEKNRFDLPMSLQRHSCAYTRWVYPRRVFLFNSRRLVYVPVVFVWHMIRYEVIVRLQQ